MNKKKESTILIVGLMLMSLAVTAISVNAAGTPRIVYGIINVDGVPTNDVTITLTVPSSGEFTDVSHDNGNYQINFEGLDYEECTFSIHYLSTDYIPTPSYVDLEDKIDHNIDLYVDTGAPANQPPIADAGGPYNGFLNVPITLDGSGSYDPDGTIVAWLWDLGDGNTSTDQNPTHTYTQTGSFPLSLTVTDDDGATDIDSSSSVTIVEDTEPPSKVTGLTVTDAKDGKLNLAWTAATDNDGVHHYKIYRDGPFLTTVTSTSYQDTGLTNGQSYEYEVSAVDNSENEGEKSDPVSGTPTETPPYVPPEDPPPYNPPYNPPENQDPVANASAGEPYTGVPEQEITFDGSSSSDPEGTELDYRWDFNGNGTYDTNWSTDPTAAHSYAEDGVYTVILQVRDGGGKTDTDETTATIATPNIPPTAPEVTGEITGMVDTEYTFTAISTDDDGDNISYLFDWGDDSDQILTDFLANGTQTSQTHTWTTAGTFTITVTTTDENGAANETTHIITIQAEEEPELEEEGRDYTAMYIIGLLIVIVIIGGAAYYFKRKGKSKQPPKKK